MKLTLNEDGMTLKTESDEEHAALELLLRGLAGAGLTPEAVELAARHRRFLRRARGLSPEAA